MHMFLISRWFGWFNSTVGSYDTLPIDLNIMGDVRILVITWFFGVLIFDGKNQISNLDIRYIDFYLIHMIIKLCIDVKTWNHMVRCKLSWV